MFTSTEKTYAPQTIDAFVFPNDEVERAVRSYLTGKNRRPLILYGPSGTGKSALATLIPNAIENAEARVYRILASSLNNAAGIEKLENEKQFSVTGRFGNDVMNYCVIEEYETKLTTISALKFLMDRYKECDLTIFTSNHFDKVDDAIKSRCKSLLVPPVPPDKFLPFAMQILAAENIKVPNEAIIALLRGTYRRHGDNRKYYEALDELIFGVRAKDVKAA